MGIADQTVINEYRQKGILTQYRQNYASGPNSNTNPDINIYNNLRSVLDKYRGRMVGPVMAARIFIESRGNIFSKVVERRNGNACGLLQMYHTYKTFYPYFRSGTRNTYARMPAYPEKALYFPPLNLWMASIIYNSYANTIQTENPQIWSTPSADLTIAVNMATAMGLGFFKNGLLPLMRALHNRGTINLTNDPFTYNVLYIAQTYFRSEARFTTR